MATTTKNGTGKAMKAENWSDQADRAQKDAAHLTALETLAPGAAVKPIELPSLDIRRVRVRLVGDSSLIVHGWSEKAKKEMLNKQMGLPSAGKEKKDPERDYRESLYIITPAPKGKPFEDGKFGFPAIAFKNAAVTACTSLGKNVVTKVAARQAFHIVGELVEIEGKPQLREDMVRLNGTTADIRYRGEFLTWSCWLELRYNARLLSDGQIINLLNTAGFAVGVGEWRSERDGSHGLFHVDG